MFKLGNRSFADLSQYPVFPWVISNYKDEEIDIEDHKNYRDLSKPLGATNPKRLNDFKFKSGDKTAIVKIKAKRQFGLLILEGVFSFGAFTVIDLITGGDRKPVPKFIDVPAILEKKTPRKQEVLHKIAQKEAGMR